MRFYCFVLCLTRLFCRYDSLGFPADLTCLVAKQAGWAVDTAAWVALSPCPFYPEGGGQAGDTGHVTFLHEGQPIRAIVKDCKKVRTRHVEFCF